MPMRVYLLAARREGMHHDREREWPGLVGEQHAPLDLFYISRSENGIRRHMFSMIHGAAMQWNKGDVYWVSESELNRILVGPPLPSQFSTGVLPSSMALNTSHGCFFVREGYARCLSISKQVEALVAMHPSIISMGWVEAGVDAGMLEFLQVAKPLPDVFAEQSLLRKAQQEKQVYVVLDMKLRAVWSVQVMLQHGWDFDDVVVLDHDEDALELIPAGEALG
ncbi:hypothetical protein B484DRAFT_249381 [Ochromonadaceae sp. CCMP2298]|nr:hypothetical protein B484DRAFT_249381 [Ochromonadaceae sp. CCMP2298]|mmetsp:Transcript_26474/g.58632  ORF Transcript_26474/g.58632 Transcript_26474/m.58632 type:complete len:222 (+) Transcript_26474:1069-1734(+)